MKVPYAEGVASHSGPESCGGDREVTTEALTGESVGQVLSREKGFLRGADALSIVGRQHGADRYRKSRTGPAWSKTLCTHGNFLRGNREIPRPALIEAGQGPHREP